MAETHQGVLVMRRILVAALLSAAWVSSHASAAPVARATVTAIDDVGKTFRCHWKTRDWTFQTTRTTTFLLGAQQAAFGDLKIGQTVKVSYHRTSGGERPIGS